jgi:LPS-assembly lipoprotein
MRSLAINMASLTVAGALTGCGFHPLYGKIDGSPGGQAIFGSMYIPPITLERVGYELRNDLIDDLQASATPNQAVYDLKVSLRDRTEPIAIQNQTIGLLKEVEITRYNYTLTAEYQIVDRKTQKVITRGTESSLSAYDVVASPYATLVAQHDAQAHTAEDISQRLRLRLAVYFSQRAGAGK